MDTLIMLGLAAAAIAIVYALVRRRAARKEAEVKLPEGDGIRTAPPRDPDAPPNTDD